MNPVAANVLLGNLKRVDEEVDVEGDFFLMGPEYEPVIDALWKPKITNRGKGYHLNNEHLINQRRQFLIISVDKRHFVFIFLSFLEIRLNQIILVLVFSEGVDFYFPADEDKDLFPFAGVLFAEIGIGWAFAD